MSPGAPMFPPRAVSALLLVACVALVAAVRCTPMFGSTALSRAEHTYVAEDGREHPYLLGQDSLSWVRKARNYLETGTACDAIVAGKCRDTLRHAPVGSVMPYADSLHIRAIAWLHRAVRWFRPQQPLELSAFLLQVLVGALGVLPAWSLGHRLGGTWGACAAALLGGLHELVLHRTLGADNELWSLVLPLTAAWSLVRALEASRPSARAGWAACSGLVVGTHAWIWSGWPFGLAFLVGTVVLLGLGTLARALRSGQRLQALRAVAPFVLVGGVLCATTVVVAAGQEDTFAVLVQSFGSKAPRVPQLAATLPPMPNGLLNVGELRKTDHEQLMSLLGGHVLVLGGLFGACLLLVGRRGLGRVELATLALSAAVGCSLSFFTDASVMFVSFGFTLPALLGLALRAFSREQAEGPLDAAAFLLLPWLWATMHLAGTSTRFVVFAALPLGLALGGSAGFVIERVWREKRDAVLCLLLAACLGWGLLHMSRPGITYARAVKPYLNDAWWDTLTTLQQSSPKDAIVHTWWPYGYWVQHIARRAVTADGASPLKRITHWTGRALMSSDAREALNLLRMISCGSDVTDEAPIDRGAMARALVVTRDSYKAHDLLVELASLTRAQASARLASFEEASPSAKAALLDVMYCDPRPSYLVISDEQVRQRDLRYQGNWDPKRAGIASRVPRLPEAEVMSFMATRLGLPDAEAKHLYALARRARTKAETEHFIARVWPPFSMTACTQRGTQRRCDLIARTGQTAAAYDAFEYPSGDPVHGSFVSDASGKRRPAASVVVADATGVRAITLDPAAPEGMDDYSVLVDEQTGEVVVGSSSAVRSVFSRLVFLPRYPLPGFERVDDRAVARERVMTFRLHFSAE